MRMKTRGLSRTGVLPSKNFFPNETIFQDLLIFYVNWIISDKAALCCPEKERLLQLLSGLFFITSAPENTYNTRFSCQIITILNFCIFDSSAASQISLSLRTQGSNPGLLQRMNHQPVVLNRQATSSVYGHWKLNDKRSYNHFLHILKLKRVQSWST